MAETADGRASRLASLMLVDERRLAGAPRRHGHRGRAVDLEAELAAAERRVAERAAQVPAPTYPADLPITARRDEIVAAIRQHPVVIVAGETGSGKSTQLPKFCLEAGRGVRGMVGHTQPRRVAARAVAERLAQELGTKVGSLVGYAVRFTDRVSDRTLVKVMTDGILLAEIQRDRDLLRYDTVIVDEAHERSLNIDFLLGYLTDLLPRRPDLRVVVTSATIDTARFSEHFGGAPVIEVSGRSYPVEVRYRPIGGDDAGADHAVHSAADAAGAEVRDQVQAVVHAVEELAAEGPGDVLVFLSGEREIHDTADALRPLELADTEVLPLYARLSAAEQHRIFEPHRGRRIVLSTNVAETSITVPGVRYVVDAGTARSSRYSRRLKVQRLPIEPVSRASADQRAGRCGRVAPGVCIRLYSEQDYESRPEFTEPEILRTSLASVILQMTALGLGDVARFPFVDPPDARAVRDGVALLVELGALEERPGAAPALTRLGRRMAQLPVDPRLARMILEADRLDCLREVLVIAAALSIRDPRERPAGQEQAAAELHRRFLVDGSDFLALVRLWDHLRDAQRSRSQNQFRRLCRDEFLNYVRVREWQDLYSQLRQVAGGLGLRARTEAAHPDLVHRALLAGLLSQIGLRDGDGREFRGTRNARFLIAPGSSLHRSPPRWVMAGELVETNRLWARTAAPIRPEWVEQAAGHLVERTWSEVRWDRERGAAVATERVTLLGLPLVAGRTVAVARRDPALARELFVRHALVEGDWDARHAFVDENRRRVDEVLELERRLRRNDLLVDDDVLVGFFDGRVPPDIVSVRHFDRWWRTERVRRPDLLDYPPELLVRADTAPVCVEPFPDTWVTAAGALRVTYEYAPGSPTDGVSVHVPLVALHAVPAAGFDWQVPGLREAAAVALVRTLPKHLRRHVAPALDHVRAALDRISPADGSLVEALARALSQSTGEAIAASAFDPNALPDHLRITFVVEDDDGQVVGSGKDLAALQRSLRARTALAFARAAPGVEQPPSTSWSFGDLPATVTIERSGLRVEAYPSLVDEGEGVSVRILTTADEQRAAMAAGTRRLLLLGAPSVARSVRRAVSESAGMAVARAPHASVDDLVADCLLASIDALVAVHGGPRRDAAGFERLRTAVHRELAAFAADVASAVGDVLASAARIDLRVDALPQRCAPAAADLRAQQRRWLRPGFVAATGAARLPDLVRWFRGMERRLDKLTSDPVRDEQRMAVVHALEQRYRALLAAQPADRALPDEVVSIRFMLEELRVSLFAQALGTAGPVSSERVRRALDAAERA